MRVGFYVQWASTLLANVFVQETNTILRTMNLFLQLAVLCCVVFLTVKRAIYPPEVTIAFWLLVGGPCTLKWGVINRPGTVATLSRAALYAALAGYDCWFFFFGLNDLPTTLCESTAFLGGAESRG